MAAIDRVYNALQSSAFQNVRQISGAAGLSLRHTYRCLNALQCIGVVDHALMVYRQGHDGRVKTLRIYRGRQQRIPL